MRQHWREVDTFGSAFLWYLLLGKYRTALAFGGYFSEYKFSASLSQLTQQALPTPVLHFFHMPSWFICLLHACPVRSLLAPLYSAYPEITPLLPPWFVILFSSHFRCLQVAFFCPQSVCMTISSGSLPLLASAKRFFLQLLTLNTTLGSSCLEEVGRVGDNVPFLLQTYVSGREELLRLMLGSQNRLGEKGKIKVTLGCGVSVDLGSNLGEEEQEIQAGLYISLSLRPQFGMLYKF